MARAPTLGSLHGGASHELLPLLGLPCGSTSTLSLHSGGSTLGVRPLSCGNASTHSPLPVDGISMSCSPFCGSTSDGGLCTCLWFCSGISSTALSPCGASPCSHTGSHSPLFGRHLCFRDSASALRLPFCGSTSCGGTSTSCLCTALSFAQRTNALGLAAMAFSALLAGLMLVILSARAGVAPTMGDAPPHSCALMHEGSTFRRSTFTTAPASLRGSGPSRITGTLPNADNTPPASCRSSDCGSGGFRSLG